MKTADTKRRFGHINVPLKRVHIELTNICNFNCVFCPKSDMKRRPGYMDSELAKRIIDELASNGICDKITFHVMGEPTLHPDFFSILEYAHHKKMNIGLTTNGAGLRGSLGRRLLDYDLHQIDISLQTPDEKSFALRKAGNLSFNEYVEGILDFFSSLNIRERETVFKFRFMNTRFSSKDMKKKIQSARINASNRELRDTFRFWTNRVYDILGVDANLRERALKRVKRLVSYKWNVVEVYRNIFFETYLLSSWVDGFGDTGIRDAWAGYCFGMRDHFAILYNGDVTLCCIDFNGHTAVGNLHHASLKDVLSSHRLGEIMGGFRTLRPVDPYCKKCLGSKTAAGWLFKPFGQVFSLKVLKPFFYSRSRLWK
jgi:MoaA/NifB/PqqE/SkfB family radical SAM enzyme